MSFTLKQVWEKLRPKDIGGDPERAHFHFCDDDEGQRIYEALEGAGLIRSCDWNYVDGHVITLRRAFLDKIIDKNGPMSFWAKEFEILVSGKFSRDMRLAAAQMDEAMSRIANHEKSSRRSEHIPEF